MVAHYFAARLRLRYRVLYLAAVPAPAVVGRLTSIAGRTYSLVKSDIGLVIILMAYSFFGAVVLHHAEYDQEQQLMQQLALHKRRCVDNIVDASVSESSQHLGIYVYDDDWRRNLSLVVEALVDEYVEHKEHLRPLTNGPEWTYWGALFFCGTVFTTVGQFNTVYTPSLLWSELPSV